ncbi:Eukaryotic translation initiation factor 3 subunit M (eIF3m), partial [Durusdinium trenchii]
HAALAKLLHVFAAEDVDAFMAFKAGNASVFADTGLDVASCENNIRLLTLASLAAQNETVSYDTVATKLQIQDTEVEKWVIDAITSKLIDAKMDQLDRKIVINRGSQRLLTEDQWGDVQQKLSSWKANVRELLKTVQSVRQEQEMMTLQQQQQ